MNHALGIEATLGRVSLRIASSLDLDDVLGEIVRGLVRELDAAMARIWLRVDAVAGSRSATRDVPEGEAARWLSLVASAGLSERLDGSRSRVEVGTLKIGQIAETGIPVCTNDLASDPRFVDKAWIVKNGLSTFAGYPLVFNGRILGVLAMFARRSLSDEAFTQLGLFAAHASIAIQNARLFAEVDALTTRLASENAYLKRELHETEEVGIVGQSAALQRVLRDIERVAKSTSTVLLRGETGTGKELCARAIHAKSPRRDGPLVKVNCGAIPGALFESELFGHEKGAFTGAATRRLGRFELAHGGTIFLDEIGELPLEAQTKLLRVIQEREIERLGGSRPIPIDVRIVAATNRDLEADVRAGRFRADLFFRLDVFPIVVPPLRERIEDLRSLARAFLDALAKRNGTEPKAITDDALAYLETYDWPGNVRELQNVLERASLLASGPIDVADLPDLRSRTDSPSAERVVGGGASDTGDPSLSLRQRVDAFERTLIADALARAGGNQSEAARALRTSRATLQYKMKTLGV